MLITNGAEYFLKDIFSNLNGNIEHNSIHLSSVSEGRNKLCIFSIFLT